MMMIMTIIVIRHSPSPPSIAASSTRLRVSFTFSNQRQQLAVPWVSSAILWPLLHKAGINLVKPWCNAWCEGREEKEKSNSRQITGRSWQLDLTWVSFLENKRKKSFTEVFQNVWTSAGIDTDTFHSSSIMGCVLKSACLCLFLKPLTSPCWMLSPGRSGIQIHSALTRPSPHFRES